MHHAALIPKQRNVNRRKRKRRKNPTSQRMASLALFPFPLTIGPWNSQFALVPQPLRLGEAIILHGLQ
jgi:hypothetical protein